MTEEVLRKTIAKNLVFYRKQKGLTQLELSEKMNYSDKSISKWERGNGIPDVPTLVQLAEIFDISVDQLLQSSQSSEKAQENPKTSVELPHSTLRRGNWKHFFISILAVSGVWFLGILTICLFRYLAPALADTWTNRICCYAFAGGWITFLVFVCLWWEKAWIFIAISGIDWAAALSVFVTFSDIPGAAVVFSVASILELAIALSYLLCCAVQHRWLIPELPPE